MNRELLTTCGKYANGLRILLLASAVIIAVIMTMMLSACGGASGGSRQSATLSGNWQFTMASQTDGNPGDPTFTGGLQGGFLLQNNGSASGQAVYSVTSSTSVTGPCNSGSAPLTVTVSGQSVTVTAVAATQTFTLTGTLSTDGSTMMGTYASTAGTAADGSVCGYAETGLQWSAISVPPITGSIQGSFHSTAIGTSLTNQNFPVSGSLTQGENIGASNATVTGTLSFVNPVTNVSDYPCFSVASVNGQISGNSVILQIIGSNGAIAGQIGEPAGSPTNVNPVTFDSVQGGYILHGASPSYMVATSACPGNLGSVSAAGDSGNICLALNGASVCQLPITLSPATVTFPAQVLDSPVTTQTITLANNSSSALMGLSLNFANNVDTLFSGQSDFNGLPNFAEQDNCAAQGAKFSLGSGESCSVTITFSPQAACPWLPFPSPPSLSGASPEWCPFAQSAVLNVKGVTTPEDNDSTYAVPITGIGLSAIQPSTPELDFGAEEPLNPPEASLPQMLTFTNNSVNPVQILGRVACLNESATSHTTLPSPRLVTSEVGGLQVVSNDVYQINPDLGTTPATVFYRCDSDPGTKLPNFQISLDTCTGTLLAPQATCNLQVTYVPQPNTNINAGLDYFLELNTVQCYGAVTYDCEIDSGRFPVELKANTPSPLRMSPSAGLDFGYQKKGSVSAPLTITLLNDPTLTNPQTITFVGKISVQGSYAETDDCTATLVPGASCTLNITFNPGSVGFSPGTLTINYSPEPNNSPQFIYLRGTGQ